MCIISRQMLKGHHSPQNCLKKKATLQGEVLQHTSLFLSQRASLQSRQLEFCNGIILGCIFHSNTQWTLEMMDPINCFLRIKRETWWMTNQWGNISSSYFSSVISCCFHRNNDSSFPRTSFYCILFCRQSSPRTVMFFVTSDVMMTRTKGARRQL